MHQQNNRQIKGMQAKINNYRNFSKKEKNQSSTSPVNRYTPKFLHF